MVKTQKKAIETPTSALDALQQGRMVSSAGAAPSIARAVRSGYGTAAGIRQDDALDTRSGQRMARIENARLAKEIYDKETRAARAAQGALNMIGTAGATYLAFDELAPVEKEAAAKAKTDGPEAALAQNLEQYAPAPGVNPEYDALSERDKLAVDALARLDRQNLEAAGLSEELLKPYEILTPSDKKALEVYAKQSMDAYNDAMARQQSSELGPPEFAAAPITPIVRDTSAAPVPMRQQSALPPNTGSFVARQMVRQLMLDAQMRAKQAIENNDAAAYAEAQQDYYELTGGGPF
tara:strand:- start:449 stop:1330 length:882 start_codon:yes stop_codon:yes gene_type:complete